MALSRVKRRERIRRGIRNKISGTPEKPRLSVFRSNKAISVQIIDDISGQTLVAASSAQIVKKGNAKIDDAKEVGKKVAELAKGKGIEKVVFDRGGYLYHGQVKALAEGARESGLKF